jgi:hypothetical protein
MSFVTVQPEMLITTAGDLAGSGSALSAENAAATAPTIGLVPAAADEVSAVTAAHFIAQAQMYRAVSAQSAAIHDQFVAVLASGGHSYADTEAANVIATGLNGV